MKMKVLSSITLVALLTSCGSDFKNEIEVEPNEKNTEVTFDAVIENGTETRTALSAGVNSAGSHSLYWTKGDAISVYDGNSTSTFTTESNGTATGKFTRATGSIKDDASAYTAFYPSSITTSNMMLPTEQMYVKDNVADFPMYARSSTKELTFKNLCGIIRLRLKSADGVKISKIALSSNNAGMSGSFTIGDDGAAMVSGTAGVSLSCQTPVTLSGTEATDFNVIVPKGSYNPLYLSIYNSDNQEKALVLNGAVVVSRSSITQVSLSLNASSFDASLELIPVTESDVDFTDR